MTSRKIFWMVIVCFICNSFPVGATTSFPSTGEVQTLMSERYPWLISNSIEEILFFEAVYGNLKLIGFGSSAWDDMAPSDKTAFFLIIKVEEDKYTLRDLTDSIRGIHTHWNTEELWLPGRTSPVVLLTASYFTYHVLPSKYIIDETGVLLGVTGEYQDITYDDSSLKVIVVDYSNVSEDWVLPMIFDDELLPPLGDNIWSSAAMFKASAYTRHIYTWDETKEEFIIQENTPVTPYAVAGTFIKDIQDEEYSRALSYLAPDYLRKYEINTGNDLMLLIANHKPYIKEQTERFLGFTSPEKLLVKTKSGDVLEFTFDRSWESAYLSKRVRHPEGMQTNPLVEPPLITSIQRINYTEVKR